MRQLEEIQNGGEGKTAPDAGHLGPEHILPMIHIAEAAISSRVQLFTEMITQKPEVVGHLYMFPEAHAGHPMASEREMAS